MLGIKIFLLSVSLGFLSTAFSQSYIENFNDLCGKKVTKINCDSEKTTNIISNLISTHGLIQAVQSLYITYNRNQIIIEELEAIKEDVTVINRGTVEERTKHHKSIGDIVNTAAEYKKKTSLLTALKNAKLHLMKKF